MSQMQSSLSTYKKQTPTSREHYLDSVHDLPGGNTRSSVYFAPYPIYYAQGKGCRLVDVDGTERLDLLNNFSSIILGHAHPAVVHAVQTQFSKGIVGSPTVLEIQYAKELKKRLPSMDLLRFCNSGTEATSLAIRAARAYTEKDKLARVFGSYHGSHDYSSVTPFESPLENLKGGIPQGVSNSVVFVPFNDIAGSQRVLDVHRSSLAAVIVEPVMGSNGVFVAEKGYLQFLRQYCSDHGIVLIFDEVISFRVDYGGAQGRLGVRPDLTCLGKVIGGGLPVGAFGGREDIMRVFDPRSEERILSEKNVKRNVGVIRHAGTFNGNPSTAIAGLTVLQHLTPDALTALEEKCSYLCENLGKIFKEHRIPAHINHIGSLFFIHFSQERITRPQELSKYTIPNLRDLFFLGSLNEGVILSPQGFGALSLSTQYTDLDEALSKFRTVIKSLSQLPTSKL